MPKKKPTPVVDFKKDDNTLLIKAEDVTIRKKIARPSSKFKNKHKYDRRRDRAIELNS